MNKEGGWKEWIVKSYHPIPTANSTIGLFMFLAFFLILLGIIITVINGKIIEVSVKYDNLCHAYGVPCRIIFDVPEKMEQPVYLFYEIDNFYQNHRRYLKSKSLTQLSGTNIDLATAEKSCDPIIRVKDLNFKVSWGTKKLLNNDDIANPCGLIAKSFFNDTFKLLNATNHEIKINEKGITWSDDVGNKFKRTKNSQDEQWIDPEDEHFIVWMRPAGLPNFRKLWGKIETDLNAGSYKMDVNNNYNVRRFDGSKRIVLSTSGPFGGKNPFLGISYIVVGIICALIAFIFYAKKRSTGGKFGMGRKEI